MRRGKLARPAIMGGFDGCASLLGVIVYLVATHPALIFPAALSGAAGSAISMGGGEWLSDSDSGFSASSVMAAATFLGALLPAIPFALQSGPLAIAESVVICCGIGFTVACLRPNRGLGLAAAETFAILGVVFGVTLALAMFLPGAAA